MAVQTPEPALGSSAPDFVLPAVDGRTLARDQCRGERGLLVMFICNHCPYVKAILPRLIADSREIQAAGVGVVAISSNDAVAYPEDAFEPMRELARNEQLPFPYLYDESQQVARAYGAVCTPDFFGYDAALRLQYRGRLDAAHRAARPPGMQRELVDAMREIARDGRTTIPQVPSIGCSLKWK
jgi:peroxiredoxin